jgi:predicted secreted Zn-dependent protease
LRNSLAWYSYTMRAILATLLFLFFSITMSLADDRTDIVSIGREQPVQNNKVLPPVVTEKYEYYEVCGCCEEELQCDLKEKCIRWKDGHKYDSLTSWDMKWDHGYDRISEACTIKSFKPIIEITYHYPRWKMTDDAPRSLVEKWDRYLKNLIVHEHGHRDRVLEAATDLSLAVAQMNPASSCADLDRNIRALFRTRMEKMKQAQREYDEITKHGATQGAAFP